jgi:2-dehydro-3-deoxygluconokinase
VSKKVLSFGELLLRICPDTGGDWLRENRLSFYVGGAEANVATALALWGTPSAYFTALPENQLSLQLASYLEEKKVDVSRILYQGDRIGLYFLPKGKDLKNAGVIYDRDHSSFWELEPGRIDWEAVLDGVEWLHFSAISPALNSRLARVCEELLEAASSGKGITISVDLNYRAKLWQYGVLPTDIMPGLVKYCDLIMGNLWAVEKMLGLPVDTALTGSGRKEDYLEHARQTSEALLEKFPKATMVANTFRFDVGQGGIGQGGPGGINYYTTFFSDGKFYHSSEYFSDKVLDKVGSGDCFMAGLIHGLSGRQNFQDTLEFATAAAFQKLFIPSDATDQRKEDILQFMETYER